MRILSLNTRLYIYIYIYRERERERDGDGVEGGWWRCLLFVIE